MFKKIQKKLLIFAFAVVSAFFAVLGFENLNYKANAEETVQNTNYTAADFNFKALSGASFLISSLSDSDENSVLMGFSVSISSSKYNSENMVLMARLVDSSKLISVGNINYGIAPLDELSSTKDDNLIIRFSFSIPKINYNVNYRCIFVLCIYGEDKNYDYVLADYTGVDTDRSVYSLAKKILESGEIADDSEYKEPLEDIIEYVDKAEEEKRQSVIDSITQGIEDYGQDLLGDYDFQKIIAIIGGLFSIVILFSFLSIIFSVKR